MSETVTLVFAVLSFASGLVWGLLLSSRGWRKAKIVFHATQDCVSAMADEILRLRGLVASLGGDPGPTPAIVAKRMEGGSHERQ